jgi:hypothetical protein
VGWVSVAFSFGVCLLYFPFYARFSSCTTWFFPGGYDFPLCFFLFSFIFSVFFVFFRGDGGYWKNDRLGAFGVTWVICESLMASKEEADGHVSFSQWRRPQ